MRTPTRKAGIYAHLKPDPNITQEKYNELKNKLEKLEKYSQPHAAKEVKRLAEMGDFSENAAYQMAKGRLRGINQRILNIKDHLQTACIIKPTEDISRIQIGHKVTVEVNGKQKQYQILGSSETDPLKGIISHNSPIGSALLGLKVGDITTIDLRGKTIEYKVLKIE